VATIIVPVLDDVTRAKATIESCLAQSIAGHIEIAAIEHDRTRVNYWREAFPQVRAIVSPIATNAVEAHSAGLDAAQSALIRFLLPGDSLDPRSFARQIKAWKKSERQIVVEVPKQPDDPPGALEALARWPQTMFSAMLFPRSVLARVGGFDVSLGEAYRARYLFRLMAAGVSAKLVTANSVSTYAPGPSATVAQTDIAALANFNQCLGSAQLWRHIPFVLEPLSDADGNRTENRELQALGTRLFEFTLTALARLSASDAGCSPLAALALSLVGLERKQSLGRRRSGTPHLEVLRSAILECCAGLSLDREAELLLTETFANAGFSLNSIAKRIPEGTQYEGLRAALRCLEHGMSKSRR
jgi:hypothetical protein